MYHTNKTSLTLAIIVIATAIALVTAGSIIASALAVKSIHTEKKGTNSFTKTSATTTRSTGDGSSLSKLISCIRGTSGLTQGAVDDCYNTAYSDSFSSNGADTYGGLVPLGSQ